MTILLIDINPGARRRVPHLWAYAIISQITPVSIAQNLFYLALLMNQPPKPSKQILTHSVAIRLGPLTVYYVCLAIVPHIENTGYLVSVVGIIRTFLFWPFLLTTSFASQAACCVSAPKAQENDRLVFTIMGIVTIYYVCIHSMLALAYSGFSFMGLITALNSNPAVSTLGYDYILSLVSAVVWYRTVNLVVDEERTTQPAQIKERSNLA